VFEADGDDEDIDVDVDVGAAATAVVRDGGRDVLSAAELHEQATAFALAGDWNQALWRWREASVMLSQLAEADGDPRLLLRVRVSDALAQVYLERGNEFASIGAAQDAVALAQRAGWRCPAALLTLARAQRNLGELSLARASYELAVCGGSDELQPQQSVLALDDDDAACADAELAEVVQLIAAAALKPACGVAGAERVALREGQIVAERLQNSDARPDPE
jgi:hypothetical protein